MLLVASLLLVAMPGAPSSVLKMQDGKRFSDNLSGFPKGTEFAEGAGQIYNTQRNGLYDALSDGEGNELVTAS